MADPPTRFPSIRSLFSGLSANVEYMALKLLSFQGFLTPAILNE